MAATISRSTGSSMGREKSTPETSARNEGPAGAQLKGIGVTGAKAGSASNRACSPRSGTVKAAARQCKACFRVYFLLRGGLALTGLPPGAAQRGEMAVRMMRQVADSGTYRILQVAPLTGALGAEIRGVDLSQPLSEAARAEVLQALYDHLVIYFPDQDGFTRERHLEFAQLFGTLQKIPHIFSVDGYPDVQIVRREPGESRRYVGEGFHADSTFLATPPTTVTMHCIEAPQVGGDTAFANLQLAYETLSPAMQKLLAGLRAVHSAARLFGSRGADPSQVMMK